MSQRVYHACQLAVSSAHRSPPHAFLDQLIDAINSLPDEVFEENNRTDIYNVMEGALGPWTGLPHRKAVMCEVLRVEAAFESDWNWNEGVDTTNPSSVAHIVQQETGAFQVSADSMRFDRSLINCVDRALGSHEAAVFISGMKSNHALAVEYCARLLRFDTSWCGTIDDHSKVIAHVRREAVAEFQSFLTTDSPPIVANPSQPIPAVPVHPEPAPSPSPVGPRPHLPAIPFFGWLWRLIRGQA